MTNYSLHCQRSDKSSVAEQISKVHVCVIFILWNRAGHHCAFPSCTLCEALLFEACMWRAYEYHKMPPRYSI